MAEIIGGYIGTTPLLKLYMGNTLWKDFVLVRPPVPATPSVGITGTMREFNTPVGTAVKSNKYSDTVYTDILKAGFDRLTPENGGKFGNIQGSQGVYNFSTLSALLEFCVANNKQLFLHTMVWAAQMPDWFDNLESTITEQGYLDILGAHIDAVLDYVLQDKYAGVVVGVDVVNEPFADNGTHKNSALYRKAPNYIPFCVKRVNRKAPHLLTFVNDYGQEYGSSAKTAALVALKAQCEAAGARLDGIGFQLHTVLRMNPTLLQTRFQMVVDADLMVHVSELDMTLNRGLDDTSQGPYPFLTTALDASAADKYSAIMDAYLTVPTELQFGFTTWSVGDADNYINSDANGGVQDYPGLRYMDYTPKPSLLKLISKAYKLRNLLIYDNFRAATRATLAGTATNGGQSTRTWTVAGSATGFGPLVVTAKGLQAASTSSTAFTFGTVDVGSANFTMVFGLSDLLGGSNSFNTNKNIMPVFRYQSTINFWYFRPIGSTTTNYWSLRKKVNDVDTTLFNDTQPANVNDVAAIIVLGNTISCYVNGRLVGSINDAAFNNQTKAGFRFRGNVDTVSAIDFIAIGT